MNRPYEFYCNISKLAKSLFKLDFTLNLHDKFPEVPYVKLSSGNFKSERYELEYINEKYFKSPELFDICSFSIYLNSGGYIDITIPKEPLIANRYKQIKTELEIAAEIFKNPIIRIEAKNSEFYAFRRTQLHLSEFKPKRSKDGNLHLQLETTLVPLENISDKRIFIELKGGLRDKLLAANNELGLEVAQISIRKATRYKDTENEERYGVIELHYTPEQMKGFLDKEFDFNNFKAELNSICPQRLSAAKLWVDEVGTITTPNEIVR